MHTQYTQSFHDIATEGMRRHGETSELSLDSFEPMGWTG
jgi:hypothetical protein